MLNKHLSCKKSWHVDNMVKMIDKANDMFVKLHACQKIEKSIPNKTCLSSYELSWQDKRSLPRTIDMSKSKTWPSNHWPDWRKAALDWQNQCQGEQAWLLNQWRACQLTHPSRKDLMGKTMACLLTMDDTGVQHKQVRQSIDMNGRFLRDSYNE